MNGPGWARRQGARSQHYYREGEGYSLCRSWWHNGHRTPEYPNSDRMPACQQCKRLLKAETKP